MPPVEARHDPMHGSDPDRAASRGDGTRGRSRHAGRARRSRSSAKPGRTALRSAAGALALLLAAALLHAGLAPTPPAPPADTTPPADSSHVVFHIPAGATFRDVVDTLVSRRIVVRPLLFRLRARLSGRDRLVKAGTYRLPAGVRAGDVLRALAEGRVLSRSVTFPEGMTIRAMAGRIAQAAGADSAEVVRRLSGADLHLEWSVPGPGLEGYLFPDTYRFAEGVGVDAVVDAMVTRHRRYWTPERRARLATTKLTEREAVTLASIIQAEARIVDEMPTISSVYHNRLRIGMPLQADPTVLYALGGYRPRLLYSAMDSVADHPYNTYTQPGLPPGPISAPGAAALDAALAPADTNYLYFVARPDGSHLFSRSLREHNAARARIRRESGPDG